ncbi:uncharacterized protein LOC144116125 isoform X3 [Amblyomma americanum]
MFLRCWNECALGSVFQYWFCTKPSDYDVVVFQASRWFGEETKRHINDLLHACADSTGQNELLEFHIAKDISGLYLQPKKTVCQDATYVISRREARERRDTCGIGGSPVCTVTPPVWRWFWVRTRSNFSSATTRFLGAGQAGDVSQKVD